MASWMVHLRIADELLDRIDGLCETEFVVGNIAPDSGVPNEDWSAFNPPTELSHFKSTGEDGKKYVDVQRFINNYFSPEQRKRYDGKAYSFYLGYLVHLLTDILWVKCVFPICISKNPSLYERDPSAAIWIWKKDFYDLDAVFLRDHPEFRAFSLYENAVGFENTYMDLFSKNAMDNRRQYITAFYRRERENPDREYPFLNRQEMDTFIQQARKKVLLLLEQYTKITATG